MGTMYYYEKLKKIFFSWKNEIFFYRVNKMAKIQIYYVEYSEGSKLKTAFKTHYAFTMFHYVRYEKKDFMTI